MTQTPTSPPIELRGIAASPGAVFGVAFLLSSGETQSVERALSDDEIPGEVLRFQDALLATRQQIDDIRKRMTEAIGIEDAAIFDAHLLMAEDHSLIEKVLKGLHERKKNAETIVRQVADEYAEAFADIDDDYVRERVADLRDVTRRMLRNLENTDAEAHHPPAMGAGSIVIADDLAPSDTVSLDRDKVVAFATDLGSETSHTAISARSLEIPAVVGLRDITSRVRHGDKILIDGTQGLVIIHPTSQQRAHYGQLGAARAEIMASLLECKARPATTRDGRRIALAGNIESTENIASVLQNGACGVGLFRTEYLFLARNTLPDEDEQCAAYTEIAQAFAPHSVTIRTMDIGADKGVAHLDLPREANPFLGWRGIRFCLARPELFLCQLRAILRASVSGNVKVMFPMVSNADEVRQALELLETARQQLRDEGHSFDADLEIGVMIEVPTAALCAHQIAPLVDFFSIGTNDLVQYSIAVDRLNERVAGLYQPTNPGVLQLIAMTAAAAREKGIWTGVCGQMASDPFLTPLLVGLGIEELSVSPPAAPLVKHALGAVTFADCEKLAQQALLAANGAEVLTMCRKLTRETAPLIIELLG